MILDNDVPAPTRSGPKYPFNKMNIGQSFSVPKISKASVMAAASTYKSRHRSHGWDFTSKTEGDFTRFWRIA